MLTISCVWPIHLYTCSHICSLKAIKGVSPSNPYSWAKLNEITILWAVRTKKLRHPRCLIRVKLWRIRVVAGERTLASYSVKFGSIQASTDNTITIIWCTNMLTRLWVSRIQCRIFRGALGAMAVAQQLQAVALARAWSWSRYRRSRGVSKAIIREMGEPKLPHRACLLRTITISIRCKIRHLISSQRTEISIKACL